MRIDPNGTIGGHPTLFVRKLMQRLRDRIDWDVGILEKVAELTPHEARALTTALEGEGFVERNRGKRGGTWSNQPTRSVLRIGDGGKTDHSQDGRENFGGVPKACPTGQWK
jgi:hypothetical protein